MTPEHRSLLMRANRLLGANLVENNLVKIESLEAANERLLELVATDNPRQSTVLGILAYELKVVKEEDVLQHVADEHGVGLVDLRSYEFSEELKKNLDVGACWATWSLPFDREEDMYYVATAYYMSPAVRTYWEKQLGGPIIWFGTTLEMLADCFEKMGTETDAKAST
ncbi:MAG TPA: hypothetical protein VL357_13690 [Rariglobus sp.]|jgi:hypothetical protein|nr:hypothetical protein [Rariglobus sp.]